MEIIINKNFLYAVLYAMQQTGVIENLLFVFFAQIIQKLRFFPTSAPPPKKKITYHIVFSE